VVWAGIILAEVGMGKGMVGWLVVELEKEELLGL
jgi:hypothetical protein